MLDTRVKLMLEHDNPELTTLAVYEFATDEGRHPTMAHEILSAFVSKRTKCVDNPQALPLKDLWRPGQHPEIGQLTILRQATYLAYHELSHLSEIEELCVQMSKESQVFSQWTSQNPACSCAAIVIAVKSGEKKEKDMPFAKNQDIKIYYSPFA